jgi:hypothetical protein
MNIERRNNFAFIDSQNLNLSIRSQGWVLDFKRFRVYLKDKYSVTKAYMGTFHFTITHYARICYNVTQPKV